MSQGHQFPKIRVKKTSSRDDVLRIYRAFITICINQICHGREVETKWPCVCAFPHDFWNACFGTDGFEFHDLVDFGVLLGLLASCAGALANIFSHLNDALGNLLFQPSPLALRFVRIRRKRTPVARVFRGLLLESSSPGVPIGEVASQKRAPRARFRRFVQNCHPSRAFREVFSETRAPRARFSRFPPESGI